MLKDEPPTSKPMPAIECHCPPSIRVASVHLDKRSAPDEVTNHCTETRQVQAILHSKPTTRSTKQQRQATRSSPSATPACEVLQKRPVQHLRVEPTASSAR